MNKEKEREELLNKVFGKGAKNRALTKEDLDILANVNTSFSNELNTIIENNKQALEKISELDNLDLETLRQKIQTDFPKETQNNPDLNISFKQVDLYNKFILIYDELQQNITCQADYLSSLCKAFRRPHVVGKNSANLQSAILISGKENTGRHSSINLIANKLKQNNIINNDNVSVIDLDKYQSKDDETNFIGDLYKAINNSEIIMFDNLEKCSSYYQVYLEEILLEGKLSLNKRYILNNNQLQETNNTLVKNSVDSLLFTGKFIIYLSTYSTNKLLNVVGSKFINGLDDILSTKEFDKVSIVELFKLKLAKQENKFLTSLNVKLTYTDEVIDYISSNYDGSNASYINELLTDIYTAIAEYSLEKPHDETINVAINIKENELYFNENKVKDYLKDNLNNELQQVKKELDEIVGLQKVKDYIYSLQDFYEVQKLKQAQGLTNNEISKHMIFTGNPGTGKTTIARLFAKYLKAIGILSTGKLVEVTRSDLVGKYVGHTAPLTMQVVNSAIGGILFIDEAYSLYRGEQDSFGLECIDTLVKAMEDNREDLIVILAGYTKEMSEFLQANSGLQSRFPNVIEFDDYTPEELYEISVSIASKAGYKLSDNVKEDMLAYYTKVQSAKDSRSGNGRLSRNLVEKAIIKQASRILKDKGQIDLLINEDFVYE